MKTLALLRNILFAILAIVVIVVDICQKQTTFANMKIIDDIKEVFKKKKTLSRRKKLL